MLRPVRRIADDYDVSTLEPGVDKAKALEFLNGIHPSSVDVFEPTEPNAELRSREDPWKARTIRARASTIHLFDVIEAGQRTKRVRGSLKPGDPATVQELADLAIQLLAKHLEYS